MPFGRRSVLLLFGFLVAAQGAQASSSIEGAARFLCDQVFNSGNYKYEERFSKEFTKDVPESYFRAIVSNAIDATDKCVSPQKVKQTSKNGEYRLISKEGNYSVVSFSLDAAGLIDGIRILGVDLAGVVVESWSDAVSRLSSLDGQTSLSIVKFGGGVNEVRSTEFQPLGSGFKLYILGALADAVERGELRWSDEYPLVGKWKSLPSGVMQDWENGKKIALSEFAEYMIKISDNTATDHLLNIVGRSNVEDQLRTMNNDFIPENTPFLSTAEMFKLKWAAPLETIERFIRGSAIQRREIVDQWLPKISLDKIGTNGVDGEKPAYIREIEWFGSTRSLCSAMEELKKKNSPEVMRVLSRNVPFVEVGGGSYWRYGGYKGGSEPGVLTMTYLLQNKSGDWGCVSVAWHNEKKNVNEYVLFDFIRKVLKLAERKI